MTPQQFIAKWQSVSLSERSACQQHFLDLCDLLGQPKPAAADPEGSWYTFEKGVEKSDGGNGWADVWLRGYFGWEYKGKHKDLTAAYAQLLQYREALENPPLLIVCDMDRFEVHTNFTGTKKQVHAFDLAGLAEPENLTVLRYAFTSPDKLLPEQSTLAVTEQAASEFGKLADGMRARGVPAEAASHFLMRLMFCMFGEDIQLLPESLFSRLLAGCKNDPAQLSRRLGNLFQAMAEGGDFGVEPILRFNGGLFADANVVDLTPKEIDILLNVNKFDWSSVEPSVFGTLFERTLDPGKRAQIGAHYTGRQDIETLLEPVLMLPLRREWSMLRQRCEEDLWLKVKAASSTRGGKGSTARKKFDRALQDFVEKIAHIEVLDPACGSGNFLYVAIHLLLDLEKEVITYAANHGLSLLPQVRPTQLAGMEINPYAQQLAQVVIWIGYLQWMYHNGFTPPRDPVLEPIESIRCMDAIVDLRDPENPTEPIWPEADVIVGNPPFVGGKMLRTKLGDEYVDAMFRVWKDRVPREADLCCYWFEKARDHLQRELVQRAGLLATQGIRGGANRKVLDTIKETGDIFFGISDREWVLDGANVHVSMVGFDGGLESERSLDGKLVAKINSNLTATCDVTEARPLASRRGQSFMADTKGGAFDIDEALALQMLLAPNPHGLPNSDVIVPWINGMDVTRRPRSFWIIDYGCECVIDQAAKYEAPFAHVELKVRPLRAKNKRAAYRDRWWIHVEPRPLMRSKLHGISRFLATANVSKHRLFCWCAAPVLPDHQLIAFAADDDYTFGVLQSRPHELWGLKTGTRLETRPRYTPSTCFETFPFPSPTAEQAAAIAAAARELDDLRSRWLNPPEWTRQELLEFPATVTGPWARYVVNPDSRGVGTARWPRLVPCDGTAAAQLKKRTLTNLYNQRPAWLANCHQRLDEAVLAAYGWPVDIDDEALLERLLILNLQEAAGKR